MNQLQMTKTYEMQELLHATFSCISYLRDLFDENSYQDQIFCNVTIKSLKRGISAHSDKFLDWLEKGCFDAIAKKYLKSLTIGIYLKEEFPRRVSEIYSFDLKYEMNEETNAESISKLVRTLCLLTQSLQPLPRVKYVTLKLFYNSNTPIGYEPPYFKHAGQHKFEFISEPLKLDVGNTIINRSEALMKIFTLFDYSHKIDNDAELKDEECFISTLKIDPKNQTELIDQTPKISNFNIIHSNKKEEPVNGIDNGLDKSVKQLEKEQVLCMCKVNKNENDMLQCDKCSNWLHTICCGFFSNNDKRIPIGEFICDNCKKMQTPESLFMLSNQRRALSVIYNEGFENQNVLVTKLSLKRDFIRKIVHLFIEEGFLKKHGQKYEVVKDDRTRNRIKEYFSITTMDERASLPMSDIKCVRRD